MAAGKGWFGIRRLDLVRHESLGGFFFSLSLLRGRYLPGDRRKTLLRPCHILDLSGIRSIQTEPDQDIGNDPEDESEELVAASPHTEKQHPQVNGNEAICNDLSPLCRIIPQFGRSVSSGEEMK